MTLVVVEIVTLNQCGVIWSKITVVAAMMLVIKKGNRVGLLKIGTGSDIFRYSRSNLGI